MKIGFIGQGYVGKNYADDFENRGYEIVRYALEEPYKENVKEIAECDIVFITVPTYTNKGKVDDSIVKDVIKNVADNSIAVIKSTVLPGATEEIQDENPRIYVMHSPEFLRESAVHYDVAHPSRNIVGIPEKSGAYEEAARQVLSVLPRAPYQKVCSSKESELIKYAGNCFLYSKVVFMNLIYDISYEIGADYYTVAEAVGVDPRIGESHMVTLHKSGPTGCKEGRGTGGNCFIKDFVVFRDFFEDKIKDEKSRNVLKSIEEKNIDLLKQSEKDLDILKKVYGDEFSL